MPASCWYAHLLLICPPPVDMPVPLSLLWAVVLSCRWVVDLGCWCELAWIRGSRGALGPNVAHVCQRVVVETLINSHLAGSPTPWVSPCYFLCHPSAPLPRTLRNMKKRPTSLVGEERPGGSCRQEFWACGDVKIQWCRQLTSPSLDQWAFTKGLMMQMMGEQEWLTTWLTWLYQCHICDG